MNEGETQSKVVSYQKVFGLTAGSTQPTGFPLLADVRLTVDDCTLLAEVLDTWHVASQDRETDIQRADMMAAAFSAMAIAAHALYEYGPPFIQIRPQHRA